MSATTRLSPGVDRHGSGYRVRLRFRGRLFTETGITDADAANALAANWRQMRKAGLVPQSRDRELLGRDAAALFLDRKRSQVSRHTKRPLTARGLSHWERALRPLTDGEFADVPVSLITRNAVDDRTQVRAAANPTSARNELDALKAVLRFAGSRGVEFDAGVLTIERPTPQRRQRVALAAEEIPGLVAGAPDYGRNLLLFAAQVGLRISEAFTLTDDRVDLAARTIHIPAALCKEQADKTIDLTTAEVSILRAQLLARAPGTTLVFPTATGRPWRYQQFRKLVWDKARKRAADAWRKEYGRTTTPYDDLTPHDLRATAATLMRDRGFDREDAAARLGHADTGELLDRVYDRGDRRTRVRRAIDRYAPDGLLQAVGE